VSIEISVISSLLAAAIGSSFFKEAIETIFKEKVKEKSISSANIIERNLVAESPPQYLTREKEAEIAADAALEVLNSTYQSIAEIRNERMRQAKLAFNVAVTLMIIGVLIIFLGILLLWLKENISSGLITIASGAVSEVLSVIVFSFNKETNNRLDEIRKELSVIETARVGLSIAKQIENLEKRDHAISELSRRIQNG
jgi:uncharacterized membrane protein